MSRDRFRQIKACPHLLDDEMPLLDGELRKIGPFLKKFGELCQAVYYPQCEVAFDEMMVRFEGRVEFVHRKQRKPTGNGIKIYVVCESLMGYTFTFEVDRRNGKTIENFVLDITGRLPPSSTR